MTAGDHYPGGSPATASLSSASHPAPIPTTTAGRLKYSTMHPKTAIPPLKENFTAKGHHNRKR